MIDDKNNCDCGNENCDICGNIVIPVGPEGKKGEKGDPGTDGKDGQGNKIYKDSGTPSLEANEGDIYIDEDTGDLYQYESGSWVFNMNITGPKGDDGADGQDGSDGTVIYDAPGEPGDVVTAANDDDLYLKSTDGSYYRYDETSDNWDLRGSLKGPEGDKGDTGDTGDDGEVGYSYNAVSDTQHTLGDSGSITLQSTDPNLSSGSSVQRLAYQSGSRIRMADVSDPENNFQEAVVSSYDDATGILTINSPDIVQGSGTYDTWRVSLAGEPGDNEMSGNWTEYDVEFGTGSEVLRVINSTLDSDSDAIASVSISSQSVFYKETGGTLFINIDLALSVTRAASGTNDNLAVFFEMDLPNSITAQFKAGAVFQGVLRYEDGDTANTEKLDTIYNGDDNVENTINLEWQVPAGMNTINSGVVTTPNNANVTTYEFIMKGQLMIGIA